MSLEIKASPEPAPGRVQRLLMAVGSFKLTLALFAILGFLAAVGTFFPQGAESTRIEGMYGPKVYQACLALGIVDIYRSGPFILVLGLMAVNLLLVTWVRIPHVLRLSRETDEISLKDPLAPKTAFTRSWETALEPAEALDRARMALQQEFPRVFHKSGPRKRMVVGERNFLSLWSAHIVHLGLFLLLLGGVVKILWGSTRQVIIKEGQSASIPVDQLHWGLWLDRLPLGRFSLPLPRFYERREAQAPFSLALEHFEIRYYPTTGAPSLFRSDLKVIKDGQVERVASVEVNDPLTQDGMMIYQASWGYDGLYSANFELTLPGYKDALDVRAPYQQRIKLLDTGWECEVTDFYPDAVMAGPGRLENGGDQLQNPAIRVRFWQRGVERTHTWFVYAVPDIQMAKVKGLTVKGKSVDPVAFTVLEAALDPGIWFAIIGAGLVVLGTFSAFYLFHRKAWILVEPLPMPGSGSRVTLAGFVRRNKIAFKRVFDRLQAGVDQALAAGSQEGD